MPAGQQTVPCMTHMHVEWRRYVRSGWARWAQPEAGASGGFHQGSPSPFAHELLERLRFGAADRFDGLGDREAGGFLTQAGGAERLPERG